MSKHDDGVNFVIYKRPKLEEAIAKRVEGVDIVQVVRQLAADDGVVTKGEKPDTAILRGTTNFTGARIKRIISDAYNVESFLQDHPMVNGISNKSPTGY
jgi:hypothetical protein